MMGYPNRVDNPELFTCNESEKPVKPERVYVIADTKVEASECMVRIFGHNKGLVYIPISQVVEKLRGLSRGTTVYIVNHHKHCNEFYRPYYEIANSRGFKTIKVSF